MSVTENSWSDKAGKKIEPLADEHRLLEFRAKPRDHLGERLGGNLAPMISRMEEVLTVPHHADMIGEEYQIATLRPLLVGKRAAQVALLHVAVARCKDARERKRQLDETRTVDAGTRAPAPKIGRAEQSLGDSDRIDRWRIEGPNMVRAEKTAIHGGVLIRNKYRHAHSHRQLANGARTVRRFGQQRRQPDSDHVGWLGGLTKRLGLDITDIMVMNPASPRPAAVGLEHGKGLAPEQLRPQPPLARRRLAQVRGRSDRSDKPGLDKIGRENAARERDVGEIGPDGVYPGINTAAQTAEAKAGRSRASLWRKAPGVRR